MRQHHGPLRLGHSVQEILSPAPHRRQKRQHEEDIDGNKDGVETVPIVPDQQILRRQDHVERDQQGPVIPARRSGKTEELSKRGKGTDGKQGDDTGTPR